MPAIVTFQSENKVYLLMNEDSVRGFDTTGQALNYFEESYNRNHSRGYEASMSATLNYIQFTPAVHEWNHDDLQPLVDDKVIDLDTFRAYSIYSISGRMKGALCTGEKAQEFHDNGITPSLIKNY